MNLADRRKGAAAVECAVAIAILLTVVLFALRFIDFGRKPSEDAAILMRYAQNLAAGAGIVWNVGEKPVDGGTDFLPLLAMAGIIKLGFSPLAAARALDIASHLLTAAIIYFAATQILGVPALLAWVCATYFLIGPGLQYINTGFTTPVFGLTAAVAWSFASALATEKRPSRALAIGFAMAALVLGLTRPEGVFLAGLMLLAIWYYVGTVRVRFAVFAFLAVFLSLGSAYFFWRWHYFGYPLPNPFYKKGGGHLYPWSLVSSIAGTLTLIGPFWIVYVAALRRPLLFRRALFPLIPIAGFTLIWILLSDEMHYMMRFQYAVLPIALISGAPLLAHLIDEPRSAQLPAASSGVTATAFAAPIVAGIAVLILVYMVDSLGDLAAQAGARFDDPGPAVALALSRFSPDHKLATTEVGILSLYSKWKVLDLWGLNDQWIAHHGVVTDAYLARFAPDVVMVHGPLDCPSVKPKAAFLPGWLRMTQVVNEYVKRNSYIPAAVYGDRPDDLMIYYVRPDRPDTENLIAALRRVGHSESLTILASACGNGASGRTDPPTGRNRSVSATASR